MKMTSKGKNKMAWIRKDIKDQLAPSPLPWTESCSTRLNVLPKLALNTSKDGAPTSSLGRKCIRLITYLHIFYVNSFLLCFH